MDDTRTRGALHDQASGRQTTPQALETRRLYQADWTAFETWCATTRQSALPASAAIVAAFLSAAAASLSAGTVGRRASAIATKHRQLGIASPCADPSVKAVLRSARASAVPRRAPPLEAGRLVRLATACPRDRAGLRDRALLLLSASGLSRAALVGLDVEKIRFTAASLEFSSTFAEDSGAGEGGQWTKIPGSANPSVCPVQALRDWLYASRTTFGPVFRKIDRWGNIEHHRLGTDALRRILARRTPRRRRGHRARGIAA